MAKRITQDDVADLAGVTRSVVSYVLNGNDRSVAADTRARILQAIETLGYRPNKAAQSLGLGVNNPLASRQIGIVLNSAQVFLRPYYAEILAGIHEKAHEEGYHIRFIRFFDELRDPLLFNSLIHAEEVCGIILMALDQSLSNEADVEVIDRITSRIRNTVCVEWQLEGLSAVTFNRQEAAYAVTRHLASLGHSRIAYIGESDERIKGFGQAMAEAGCTDFNELVSPEANDMATGHQIASTFLPRLSGVSAIFAGSDEVAMGVLRYLHQHGLRVPADIALASIDDLEVASFSIPPLTTVSVQKAAMGRQAVQLLINQDRSKDLSPITILLPSKLIVRESCGSIAIP